MSTDGGVAALYGFRYQMLRTMERLLDLQQAAPGGNWAVEVEHATHDSVDYAEYRGAQLTRVVQVKASRPGAITRLSAPEMERILNRLSTDFPAAEQVVVESNRDGGWNSIAATLERQPAHAHPRLVAWRDTRDLEAVYAAVIARVSAARMLVGLPSTPEVAGTLACLLEARLWQTATLDATTQPSGRRQLVSCDIEALLAMPDRDLAYALGEVTWSTRWHLPSGRWIPRPAALSFLEHHLSSDTMPSRRVPTAVLTGFGGLGKSTCAASFANLHVDQYAMIIWLNASTKERLVADVQELLSHQHGADIVAAWDEETTRTALIDWLGSTPRSWLLVFDDADRLDTIQHWIPQTGYGHVLVTSRDAAWPASHAPSLELGILTDAETRDLVTQRLGATTITDEDMQHLAILTDQWALAVDMVLAWLLRTGRTLNQLGDYQPHHARQRLLEKTDLLPIGYPAPVLHVILDSIATLQDDNPAAHRLLQAVVALGADAVPTRLVAGNLASPDPVVTLDEEFACDDLIAELRRRSLVQPASLEDPRLGAYRHRLAAHGLIADTVAEIDPIDDDRWIQLTHRLSILVGACSDEQDIPLGLSLAPVIAAVDQAVEAGAKADIYYLTLLGNTANLWAAAGNYPVAIYRLVRERNTARRNAKHASDAGNLFAWFAAVASASLVPLLIKINRYEQAMTIAEEIAPELHKFIGQVNPAALDRLVEGMVGAMEVVRHDHLKDRATSVLHSLDNTGLTAPLSAGRAMEQALARDDFITALAIADATLPSTTGPVDRIELLGRRAEALATSDPDDSDNTLREAIATARTHELDPHTVPTLALNTLHQRVLHLLSQPITADPALLRRYSGWFDILDDLTPQPDGAMEQTKLTMAYVWRDLINDHTHPSPAAQQIPPLLQDARSSGASTDELIGLHSAAHRTLLIHDYLQHEEVLEPTAIARSGNNIFLQLELKDALRLAIAAFPASTAAQLTAIRYGMQGLLTYRGIGIYLDLTQGDPFARTSGSVGIYVAPPVQDLIGTAIDPSTVVPLGEVANMRADPITEQMYARHSAP